MSAWMYFWGLLLAVTLFFYAVLVVYVTIGGFKDIKQMFKVLGDEEEQAATEEREREKEPD